MNWMDIVILSLLVMGTIFGVRSGLVWQLGRLVALAFSIVATAWWHEPVGNYLATIMANETGARLISYTLTFIVAYGLVWLFTALVEWKLRKSKPLKATDRALGGAFGLAKMGLLVGAVLMGFAVYAVFPIQETMSDSFMAKYLVMGMQQVAVAIPDHYRKDLSDFSDKAYNYAKDKGSQQVKEGWQQLQEKTLGKSAAPTQPPAKTGR